MSKTRTWPLCHCPTSEAATIGAPPTNWVAAAVGQPDPQTGYGERVAAPGRERPRANASRRPRFVPAPPLNQPSGEMTASAIGGPEAAVSRDL